MSDQQEMPYPPIELTVAQRLEEDERIGQMVRERTS